MKPDTYLWKKNYPKVGRDRNYLHLIMSIYNKTTANIILNNERMNTFPWSLETRQRFMFPSLLCNIILQVIVSAIRQ